MKNRRRSRGFGEHVAREVILVLAVALLGAACGGSGTRFVSPTVSATPGIEGPSLFVASGLSGLPLAGVSVQTQAGSAMTDANGRALLPASTQVGSPVDISAPEFLTRQTALRSGGERIFLWPRLLGSGAAESYTTQLVYTSTAAGAELGAAPLRRVVPGLTTAWVFLPPEFRSDRNVEALRSAIAEVNIATQNVPRYELTFDRPTGNQIVFDIAVDGTPSTCTSTVAAFFRTTLVSTANSNEIYGGLINLCAARWAEDIPLLTHELGHSLGLYHSERRFDTMHASTISPGGMTGEERLVIFLALHRRGGNRYPDSDRAAQTAASVPHEEIIVCGR